MQGTGPAEAGKFLQYWARVEFWVSAPLISQLLTSWPLPKTCFSFSFPFFFSPAPFPFFSPALTFPFPFFSPASSSTCHLLARPGCLWREERAQWGAPRLLLNVIFPFSCCAKTCFPLDIEAIVCPYPCLRPPLPDRGLRHGYQSLARCGQQRPVAISLISQGGWKLSPIC